MMVAHAKNNPGQNGGNQNPIFIAHIDAVRTQEITHPTRMLVNHSLVRKSAILSTYPREANAPGYYEQTSTQLVQLYLPGIPQGANGCVVA